MCGIYVLVEGHKSGYATSGDDDDDHHADKEGPLSVPEWLIRRGPDIQNTVQWDRWTTCTTTTTKTLRRRVTLSASVLGMREKVASQPVTLWPQTMGEEATSFSDSNHHRQRQRQQWYLCWNGEVYQSCREHQQHESRPGNAKDDDQDDLVVDGDAGQPTVSDTEFVADLLRHYCSPPTNHNTSSHADADNNNNNEKTDPQHPDTLLPKLATAFSRLVNAEFAFCLVTGDWVYYAKDAWGRRSLLTGRGSQSDKKDDDNEGDEHWSLSSVAMNETTAMQTSWTEVEAGVIFAYNVNNGVTHQLSYKPANVVSLPLVDYSSLTEPAEVLLLQLLRVAVRRRIAGGQPIAVLFSGGLDSVVLAALVLEETAQVTLANVSFVKENDTAPTEPSAADTRAAIESCNELKELFPHAQIIFCQRQVEWREIEQEQSRVSKLIYPKTTVMDLNIATAFWFAASTATSARILLSGLGADEQMGGYGRHRKAWEKGGNTALRLELEMDKARLWERNLGRDDRVLSDTSKEARYPYLDNDVVHFLHNMDLDKICDYNLAPGQGDKRILRDVAKRLGLEAASSAVKRAIQFGSRIAHVSDKKRFGSRSKASGVAEYSAGGSG